MIVSDTQKPPAHPFYGDSWERGLDPWHEDAFPDEFKDQIRAMAGGQQPRQSGWFLLDGYGNAIGFIQDGTEYPDMKSYTLAKIAYAAYCTQTGGISLVSGDKLPEFDSLRQDIQDAWFAAAEAVKGKVDGR